MLVNLLVELNEKVPQLGADVERFPDDNQVQQPLQDVYASFFDSYAKLMGMLGERTLSKTDFLETLQVPSTADAIQSSTTTLVKTNESNA